MSDSHPDSKVNGANMGPIWGQQDPGGPHVSPMNFAIWVYAPILWNLIILNSCSIIAKSCVIKQYWCIMHTQTITCKI